MAVTFAKKLEQMPHYEAGLAIDAARERFGAEDAVKLASNESPWGPHPAVVEAVARAAADAHRYPEQFSPTLRRRLAERHETEPGRIAVGNGDAGRDRRGARRGHGRAASVGVHGRRLDGVDRQYPLLRPPPRARLPAA